MKLNFSRRFQAPFIVVALLLGATLILWWPRLRPPPPTALRILCPENWLSAARLEDFANRRHAKLNLFTYSTPGEFVRQMANADGRLDVVCAPSFAVRALIKNQWLKRLDYLSLPPVNAIAADFLHLPYDPRGEFTVPLFWDAYGLVGKPETDEANIRLWAADDWVLMTQLSKAEAAALDQTLRRWAAKPGRLSHRARSLPDALGNFSAALLPRSQVARWEHPAPLNLPGAGAPLEVGLLAVGERSASPRLALDLVEDLLSVDHAREVHARLGKSFVQSAFNEDPSVADEQRPKALRQLELNRLQFPDLDLDLIPRFSQSFKSIFPEPK